MPVGRVGRPHGLDGAFVVEHGSDDDRRYRLGGTLYVDGEPAEIVLSRRVGARRRAVKLDRPVERGQLLAVRLDDLPPPDSGGYYVFQLVGLLVLDADGAVLGTVQDVLPGPANDSLELDSGALVPLVEDAVLEIDLDRGRIVVSPGYAV